MVISYENIFHWAADGVENPRRLFLQSTFGLKKNIYK